MAERSFPYDAGAGANVTEAQWRDMARLWRETGVVDNALNEYEVFADSTGMQVKAKSGRAWVEGHFAENDAEKILAIAAVDPTNPRIDRVVLRNDFVGNTTALAVLTGTPAASPTAPALTQNTVTWEISLAQVAVAAGAATIAAGNVTDERTIVGLPLRQKDGVLQTGTIPFPRLSTAEASGQNAGIVTLPVNFVTDVAFADLGTVTTGDRILVTAMIAFAKSVTAGNSQMNIDKALAGGGTATIQAGDTSGLIKQARTDHPAGTTWSASVAGIVKVTAGGTLKLALQALSQGSDGTVQAGSGQIHALRLKA